MEFKFIINQELDSIQIELEKKRIEAQRAKAMEHDHAAKRIKSALWDTDRRFRKLSEDLEFTLNTLFKNVPSVRRGEFLLDRNLTKKEGLMENS
jgi:hypothetical protein